MSSPNILIKGGRAVAPPKPEAIISIEEFAGHNSAEILSVDGHESLETIQPHLERTKTVIVNFPAFTDGRGFSLGRLLRHRAGFEGELIASGPLIPDQYAYAIQCGFSAVKLDEAVHKRQGESNWFNALSEFGLTYQRGYAVPSGPSTSVLDARDTGYRDADTQDSYHGLSAEQSLKKAIEAYEGFPRYRKAFS